MNKLNHQRFYFVLSEDTCLLVIFSSVKTVFIDLLCKFSSSINNICSIADVSDVFLFEGLQNANFYQNLPEIQLIENNNNYPLCALSCASGLKKIQKSIHFRLSQCCREVAVHMFFFSFFVFFSTLF